MRGRLLSYLVVFFLVSLASMSQTFLSPSLCLGSESGAELATFSLEADQQALGEVLQQIAETTGYEITIDPEYAKLPITASLKNVTVEEALRRILGKLSRYMVIDEVEKKISVRIVDAEVKKTTATGSLARIDSPNLEALPPPVMPGEPEISQGELDEMNKNQMDVKPPNLEALPPPVMPGELEITPEELNELSKNQMNVKPPNLEALPPPVMPENRKSP